MTDRRILASLTLAAALGLGAGSQAQSGNLAFTASSATIGESDGAVEVTVERLSGSDGLVTVDIATVAGTATGDVDFESNSSTLVWGSGDSSPQTFSVVVVPDSSVESSETFQLVLSDPQFGATLGSPSSMTVTIVDDDSTYPPCVEDETTLCLQDDRFQVTVDWRRPPQSPDWAAAKVADFQTDDSGLFYFITPSNLELLLKVLDACTFSNFYWVFFAATTDVEFVVTVTDTQADTLRVYTNPLYQSADAVTDTEAFATCP